jgi:hypothetical protein
MRRLLLATLLLGLAGTLAELLLLAHTDGALQLAPVLLVGLALGTLIWYGLARSRASLRTLQGVMLLMLVSGMVGVWLHFGANVEWERESNPSLGGLALYRAALAGAMPVLAPGSMVQLALVGIAFTWRHPALTGTHGTTPLSGDG